MNLVKNLLCYQMTEKASDQFISCDTQELQEDRHALRMITENDVEEVEEKVASKLHSSSL